MKKLPSWLFTAGGVRRSARFTLVERALRARFRLWLQNRDKSGLSDAVFSQLQGRCQGNGGRLTETQFPC